MMEAAHTSETVLPRRFWASYSPPWELEISQPKFHSSIT
jgi:hypothetical protein